MIEPDKKKRQQRATDGNESWHKPETVHKVPPARLD